MKIEDLLKESSEGMLGYKPTTTWIFQQHTSLQPIATSSTFHIEVPEDEKRIQNEAYKGKKDEAR